MNFADKRILTVDDSATIRRFVKSALSQQGAHVDEAPDGARALEQIRAGVAYDLILLDLMLPDMDGLTLLASIREQHNACAVVVLTGTGGLHAATSAVRSGADGYINKQDLTIGRELTDFFYSLEQAIAHRAGLVAQEQLAQVKADFYSMVTHDLRSPASTILLSLSLLTQIADQPLTDTQRELLDIAQEASNKILRLIGNYLDYARIEAGFLQLHCDWLDLREVVRAAAAPATLQAQAKGHTVHLDLPQEAVLTSVDGERFKQVCDNLMSNAIKYTPEGGEIYVSLRREADAIRFVVRDNGMGIPPEQLPALFTRYHRVPGEAVRGIFGTGLGLLIVKEIVEAHHGTVEAHSTGEPGEGTTFTVTLPLPPPLPWEGEAGSE